MKLILNQNPNIVQPQVTIEYDTMTHHIQRVVDVVENDGDKNILLAKDEAKDRDVLLKLAHICYLDAVDKRVYAYTKTHVYRVDLTLTVCENDYSAYGFIRINKSNIVNVHHIKSIQPAVNMRVHVVLHNGDRLVINRSYKKAFEQFLKSLGGA